MFVEKSGLGPTDGTRVTVDTTGAVELVTGGASLGQGFETVMAQICADSLGVDYQRVRVVHGRTDRIEHGIGAHASRATNVRFFVCSLDRDDSNRYPPSNFCRPDTIGHCFRICEPTA